MNSYWKDKKVLVTGAGGFIGSHLTERLAREGARVRAFVFYNSFNRWGWLDDTEQSLLETIDVFPGDVRDSNRVLEAVEGHEVVFHLASLIAIPYSYYAPDSYVQTNIGGTLNILNACRTANVLRLVHTSTSEVYGTAQYVPIDEKHPLQGQSPYSATKIAADMLAESFYRSFRLPVTTVRPFNTYGPRQSARAVIPTVLSQILQGARQIRLGSLHPTRDFNYVADTVSGFLSAGQSEKTVGQTVNLGSGSEISIGNLVKIIMSITETEVEIITDDKRLRPPDSEVDRLLCNASKVKEFAGWIPKYTLKKGLEETFCWMKKNLKYYKSRLYNI
jgi:dTDP-glucose 4,6-dehydratase